MADTAINDGNRLRFENAGVVRIVGGAGANDATILKIEPGSLRLTLGGTEGISQMDRAQLEGEVLEGDERPCAVSFSVSPTKNGFTDTANLLLALRPAASGGKKVLRDVQVDIPDAIGGTTGTRLAFDDCWLSGPLEYSAGGRGQNTDVLAVTMQSEAPMPTASAYS